MLVNKKAVLLALLFYHHPEFISGCHKVSEYLHSPVCLRAAELNSAAGLFLI